MRSCYALFVQTLRRMRHEKRGNVFMIFAFALIPLMATVGAAVDYSQAARSRSHMQEAANAAALAAARTAQTYMNQNGNTGNNWQSAQALGSAQYQQVFAVNSAGDAYAQNMAPALAWTLNADGSVAAQVTAAATVPTSFMKIIGIKTVPIQVLAQATGGGKVYYNIVFVVDTSNSMAIGGDSTTISNMQKSTQTVDGWTSLASAFAAPEGNCAFACHDPNSTETNNPVSYYCKKYSSDSKCIGTPTTKQVCTGSGWRQTCSNQTTYSGGSMTYCPGTRALDCVMWDDKRNIAKYLTAGGYASVLLKIDAVNSAINTFVQNLKTPMSAAPDQYQVAIWTFASTGTAKKIFPDSTSGSTPNASTITTYYNELNKMSSSIDLETATVVNMPYNHGYTYTSEALNAAYKDIQPSIGNGTTSATRKTFFIFLTDGAEDIAGSTYANRQVVTNYTTTCSTIKNYTINSDASSSPFIYSIETAYPVVPNDNQYAALIGNNTKINIPTAMQNCASSGGYLSASDNAGIAQAVQQVFTAITSGNLRLTK